MKAKKITYIYCFSIGIINLLTWTILIITNQVPNIKQELTSLIFHWFSEFLMAVTMIIAGILIAKQHRCHRKIFYFGSGMLMLAIIGASIYYIIHFDFSILIMSLAITGLTIFFASFHYQRFFDFYFLSLGVIIYGAINVLGNMIQKMDLADIVYISLPLLFATLAAIWSLKLEL